MEAHRRRGIVIAGSLVLATIAVAVPAVRYLTRHVRRFPDALAGWPPHRLRGPVLARYRAEGGPVGHLGLPLSSEVSAVRSRQQQTGCDREVRFERGVISVQTLTGRTHVVYYDEMVGQR